MNPSNTTKRLQEQVIALGLRIFPLVGKVPQKGYRWKDQASSQLVSTDSYGIVCDKIAVVDTDTREKAVWWYKNRPRTPWMVKTPRGVHFYYSGSSKLSNGAFDDLDLRAGGKGYVVGPGSVRDQKEYELIGHITLDLPEFDTAWLPCSKSQHHNATTSRDTVRNARAYIQKIHAVSGSGGHNATFRAACKCRLAGLSEAETLAELIEWNKTNANPPWGMQELLHKVTSAYERSAK